MMTLEEMEDRIHALERSQTQMTGVLESVGNMCNSLYESDKQVHKVLGSLLNVIEAYTNERTSNFKR